MKTKSEIHAEAQHLTTLGRQYHRENAPAFAPSLIVPGARVLMTLPGSPSVAARQIDATVENGELLFRLLEPREDQPSEDRNERTSLVLLTSDSAYDVLRAGYELAEEERLAARLARFAEWSETGAATGEAVADVETILETHLLAPSDRMRAKAEIVEFLAGRMDGTPFIANAVERQCEREGIPDRRSQRHELTLTIDKP